jgi:DNA processing protein
MSDDLLPLLRLHLTGGVGVVTYKRLLRRFGSAEGVLNAPRHMLLDVEGVGPATAESILDKKTEEDAKKEIDAAAAAGVRIVAAGAQDYPHPLRFLDDGPIVLYVKGDLRPADALAIAIVGSRRCSHYGREQAGRLAQALARLGFCIVSGLARGIDSAAHAGALEAGGRTLAVLGNGLASIYPPENKDLAARVAASGALLSEFPMETPPLRENFPRRNRVLSGLALGVIVVEGDRNSGALITARFAMEQGKEVFAVPGMVTNTLSSGPHSLIKQGAKLVETVDDVLDELGEVAKELRAEVAGASSSEPTKTEAGQSPVDLHALNLSPRERKVYDAINVEPTAIDDIIHHAGVTASEAASTLLVLEVRRAIKQLPGKVFVRAK